MIGRRFGRAAADEQDEFKRKGPQQVLGLLRRLSPKCKGIQTQGIQQLLVAEKRAAEKVSEARKRKNRRLKQAKEEAQAEIERYKAEREGQFRDHEARYAGSKGENFTTFITGILKWDP